MTEPDNNTENSFSTLNVSFDEDYLHQLQDIENQDYIQIYLKNDREKCKYRG